MCGFLTPYCGNLRSLPFLLLTIFIIYKYDFYYFYLSIRVTINDVEYDVPPL